MEYFKASPYSYIFWNEYKINPLSNNYNIIINQTIEGKLDVERLRKTIQLFLKDFILFNSHINEKEKEIYWVKNEYEIELVYYENTSYEEDFMNHIFNLEEGPLCKFGLFKREDSKYDFIVHMHHLVIDGLSAQEFLDTISKYYNENIFNKPFICNDIKVVYEGLKSQVDLILESGGYDFWKNISHEVTINDLPFNNFEKEKFCPQVIESTFSISKTEFANLTKKSEIKRINPFLVFINIWGILVAKYCSSNRSSITYPVGIRKGMDLIYGAHINSSILPIEIDEGTSFKSLYEKTLNFMNSTRLNGKLRATDLPTHQIFKALNINGLNVSFAQTNLVNSVYTFKDCNCTANHQNDLNIGSAALSLRYEETSLEFNFRLNYLSSLSMEESVEHFRNLMHKVFKNPNTPINQLEWISEKEKESFISWNNRNDFYPKDKNLISIIEELVHRTPERTAIMFGEREISYSLINEKSNQLAHFIKDKYYKKFGKELKRQSFISIFLEKTPEMIIAILAILKLECIYVPISIDYPQERINFILDDTKAEIVITSSATKNKIKEESEKYLTFDIDVIDYSNHIFKNMLAANSVQDVAYIMYTSGTTGKPKGVLITHQAIISLVSNNYYISISEKDKFLFLSNPGFDASTFEIWGALINGAALVILCDIEMPTVEKLKLILHENQISILWLTKALFDNFYLQDSTLFKTLSYLLVGGESLNAKLIKNLIQSKYRPKNILNGYGPTENTTFTTIYPCEIANWGNNVPLGKPINSRKVYILDANLKQTPIGVKGEMYLGGAGLSRGYLNAPELNADKFINNHLQLKEDIALGYDKLYRSGDYGRWLPDGNIEYLGRIDNQIKIRGFRIELDEIEFYLSEHKKIKQSAVVLKANRTENTNKDFLIAYYVADESLSREELIDFLSDRLPHYMVPSFFIQLKYLPTNSNGKLDKNSLPEVNFDQRDDDYVAPTTLLEEQLCNIWKKILEIDKVSIVDDFSALGGDSIMSILLAADIQKLGFNCPTRMVLENKTVQRQAQYLQKEHKINLIAAEQGILEGEFDLAPIQKWFNSIEKSNINQWNQSFLVKTPQLDIFKLEKAVSRLVEQHDMLRTLFKVIDNKIVAQHYQKEIAIPFLKSIDIQNLEKGLPQILRSWQSSFNIEKGPLWQIGYVYDSLNLSESKLFFAFHHLIIDTVSWRIIINDLYNFYQDRNLEAYQSKSSSYREWIYSTEKLLLKNAEERFWSDFIKDDTKDNFKIDLKNYSSKKVEWDENVTKKLTSEISSAFHTEINDILLTALGMVLYKLNKKDINYITLEGHGRNTYDENIDTSNTIGWFTAIYPVRLQVSDSIADSIISVKESLRKIKNRELSYHIFKYSKKSTNEIIKAHRLPRVSFNYIGQFHSKDKEWELTNEDSGMLMEPLEPELNVLNINGGIINNKLCFQIDSYLKTDIALEFYNQLNLIIDFCEKQIFENKSYFTLSDFPLSNINRAELDRLQEKHPLENIYFATDVQKELMYFNKLNFDYQIDQVVYKISGEFDLDQFKEAWNIIFKKHDILRAGFTDRSKKGFPLIFICKTINLPFEFEDWSLQFERNTIDDRILKKTLQERNKKIDFDDPPLIRLLMIKHNVDEHHLIITFNHILFDGWSLGIMITELIENYYNLQNKERIAQETKSFMPFVSFLKKEFPCRKADEFWRNYLLNAPKNQRIAQKINSKIDFENDIRMKSIQLAVSTDLTKKIYLTTRKKKFTANQIAQLAWMTNLSYFFNSDDVVIGTTMSERPSQIANVTDLVGLFVAAPPLRLSDIKRKTTEELLLEISNSQANRQEYAFFDLNIYDSKWKPKSPYGCLFVFENMPEARINKYVPFNLDVSSFVSGSNHQMVICLFPKEKNIELSLFFDSTELSEKTACEVIHGFIENLQKVINNLNRE